MKSIYLTLLCFLFIKAEASVPQKNLAHSNLTTAVSPNDTKSNDLEFMLGRKATRSEKVIYFFHKKKVQKALRKGDDNFWGIPKWYFYFAAGMAVVGIILALILVNRASKLTTTP